MSFTDWRDKAQKRLTGEPERILTAFLIIDALALIVIALWPNQPLLKAAVLAYVVLP